MGIFFSIQWFIICTYVCLRTETYYFIRKKDSYVEYVREKYFFMKSVSFHVFFSISRITNYHLQEQCG
jgi:hypothetical protein